MGHAQPDGAHRRCSTGRGTTGGLRPDGHDARPGEQSRPAAVCVGHNVFVDTARVQSPKYKGRVGNQIAYARESWFAGERFGDLQTARQSARLWCRDIAGARDLGSTRNAPREVSRRKSCRFCVPPRRHTTFRIGASPGSYRLRAWRDATVTTCVGAALLSIPDGDDGLQRTGFGLTVSPLY
jgi:hypothetical protein